MKKTGILTYYYETHNYGGMLQSYALPLFLKKNNILAEQICYVRTDEWAFTKADYSNIKKSSFLLRLKNKLLSKKYVKKICPKFKNRNRKFSEFEKCIPHSQKVYNLESISQTNEMYDNFIVGSDQIWSFRCFNPTFFGEFVSVNRRLISYAASAGKSVFLEKEKKYLRDALNRFEAISVREKDLVNTISSLISKKEIKSVVDPTLLLEKEDWDKITSDNLIEEQYLFCYFLGSDTRLRKLARKYAKMHGLKIVTIPFANQSFNSADFGFGDMGLYDAGPSEFVTLIKNAECIFTDSFHATVFSLIYEKQFFVFDRIEHKGMSSRLCSLTEMFECTERFCDSNDKFDTNYLNSVLNMDYNREFTLFESEKRKSISFLLNNLNEK